MNGPGPKCGILWMSLWLGAVECVLVGVFCWWIPTGTFAATVSPANSLQLKER
jgi:hypothetical protein